MQIKLIKSTFYHESETKDLLCDFIRNSNHLSIGPHCLEFERLFSRWQGREYSIFFNSGSSANLALIQAFLNLWTLSPGDRVGFSWITWATNVMPLLQLGLEPVPVDVELETLNVSVDKLESAHRKHRLKALFLTDLLGFSDDVPAIRDFCEREWILLFEDNCESLWSVSGGKKLGNFGIAATFSFFVGHHMSTLEGGIVATDDRTLADELRKVRSHWWDRNLEPEDQKEIRSRYGVSDFYAKYTFYDLAYNLRPTEINGFVWKHQIKYLDEIVEKRESNYRRFREIYDFSDDFYRVSLSMDVVSNFAFPLIAKSPELMEKYVRMLDAAWIEIRPIVWGIMTEQPFFKKYVRQKFSLPNAELIHHQGFYFGNNPEMIDEEIEYIINVFKNA